MKATKRARCGNENGRPPHRRRPAVRWPGASLLVAGLLLGAAATARAVILGGSVNTSMYVQTYRPGNEVLTQSDALYNRANFLGSGRLDALQLGPSWLSFHTSFNGTNSLTNQNAKETQFGLYRAFLQAANRSGPLRYDARLGRQWITAGVGAGAIDGVSLSLSQARLGDVSGFFGTLGTDRILSTTQFWSLDKVSESRSYGGRIRCQRPLGVMTPTIAVSYGQISRKPNDVLVTDAQLIGVSAELRLTRGRTSHRFLEHLRIWGDTRQDLIYGRSVNETGGLEYQEGPRNFHGWVEYNRRRPELRATDLFASFDSRPVNQLRLGIGREVYGKISVDLTGDVIRFNGGDKENGAELMVSGYGCTVGYRAHGGYGGTLNGLILYGHRDLGRRITLDANVNLTSYKYGEIRMIDDREATGVVAAGYRLWPNLTLTAQAEGLQNAGFTRDVRFLGMINWRFRSVLN